MIAHSSVNLSGYWNDGGQPLRVPKRVCEDLTGKSTVQTWTDFRFRTGLDAGDFTTTGLKRIR